MYHLNNMFYNNIINKTINHFNTLKVLFIHNHEYHIKYPLYITKNNSKKTFCNNTYDKIIKNPFNFHNNLIHTIKP